MEAIFSNVINIRNAVTEDAKEVSDDNQVRTFNENKKMLIKSNLCVFFSSKELTQKLEKLDIGESEKKVLI